VLGAAAHELLLETRDSRANRGFDLTLRFHERSPGWMSEFLCRRTEH
jgi:hypothetical protein